MGEKVFAIFLFVLQNVLQELFMTVRMPQELRKELMDIVKFENLTLSEVVKHALAMYCDEYFSKQTPYEIGKQGFGIFSSGRIDISKNRKKELDKILHDKISH